MQIDFASRTNSPLPLPRCSGRHTVLSCDVGDSCLVKYSLYYVACLEHRFI